MRGNTSVSASLRTTMGHFGLPEPPPAVELAFTCEGTLREEEEEEEAGTLLDSRPPTAGPLEEDDTLRDLCPTLPDGHDHSRLPGWQSSADLAGPGSHLAQMQDSVMEDNAATSFVMRSSPFQALTPSRRPDSLGPPRPHERVHRERPQDRSCEGRMAEAENALTCVQQWLPPCEAVPEEHLEQSLSQVQPLPAVSRHRGSQPMPPPLPPASEDFMSERDESFMQGSLSGAGLIDACGVAVAREEKEQEQPGTGPAADDTDADYAEPVQPLRTRTRGLPGNTAPQGDGAGAPVGVVEKKPRPDKQPPTDGAGSPPPPLGAAPARAGSSPLSDPGLSVQAAAAAVSLRDLAEIRSFRNPPAVVCQVLEAAAVLLGVDDVRWAGMRKLLDKDFVAKIRAFDPAGATPAQAERLAVLLQVPTFSDGLLGERCPAVLSLAAWCNAVGRQLQAPLPSAAPAPMPLPSSGGRSARRETSRGTVGSPGDSVEVEAGGAAVQVVQRPDLGGLEVEPDLWSLGPEELARVRELRIGRQGVGAVTFHGVTDCRSLVSKRRLSDIIVLNPGEVVVYPNQTLKPPVGVGLNKPASVVLYGCLPKAQGFKDRRARERYKKRVRQMTEDKGAEFVDYDCDEGVWQFRVAHF